MVDRNTYLSKLIHHCGSIGSFPYFRCDECAIRKDPKGWEICCDKGFYEMSNEDLVYLSSVIEPNANNERYWSNICEMQRKQTEKGKRTYGQILEENTSMSVIERLEYLEEELIDALMYIEHIKALSEVSHE